MPICIFTKSLVTSRVVEARWCDYSVVVSEFSNSGVIDMAASAKAQVGT